MKRFVVCLAAVFLAISGTAFAFLSSHRVDGLIQAYVPNTHVGVVVADAASGKILYQHQGNENFMPASNLKLFTAAATLIGLGTNYRYQTVLYYQPAHVHDHVLKGNVYVRFSGDPSLTDKDLGRLVAKLKARGITQIDGNIIFDSHVFKEPNYLMGATFEDLNWYYSAPVSAIIVNQNKVTLHLNPAKKIGQSAIVTPKHGMAFVTLTHHVKTVSYDQAMHHCQLLLNVNEQNHIDLGGCWPIYGAQSELNIAVKNPAAFAEHIIKKYLKTYHMTLNGIFKKGRVPVAQYSGKIMHLSVPIKTLLITLLQESNNLYATAFTKTLGVKYFHVGTIQEGVNAIQKILTDHFGLSFEDAELRDGVGTQYNLVSPMKINELLYHVYHSPDIYPYFLNALPHSGNQKNTTLEKSPAFKYLPPNVYAKTGSLHSANTLSGYIKTRHQRMLTFSFLMDDTRSFSEARTLQAKLSQYFANTL
jgi:D-alanyl-D-alanine carboxypeptidase/D-alanyl-D-alanine-endopeptidase (penicillin-binding protein 4)